MSIFYERITGLLEEHELTKKALAEILHVTPNTVNNWSKDHEPGLSVIVEASKYFQVSADYLLGLTNKRDYHEPDEPLAAKELELIYRIKGRFSNAQLDSIMKVINGLERYNEAGSQVQPENKIEKPSGEEIVSH